MLGPMALDLSRSARTQLADLRIAPCAKRLRAHVDGQVVLDTTDSVLVWEPRRVVPEYAVPPADLRLDLSEVAPAPLPDDLGPVLLPGRFAVHTTSGRPLAARLGGRELGEVAFAPDDPDVGGRVVLDFGAFTWVEEEQPVTGHPHDPFSRIDLLRSDRHVTVRHGDVVLADSRRAVALFETGLPVRWYLPREDVRLDLMSDSETRSTCAYKGVASYLSAEGDDGRDVAWSYPEPLPEVEAIRDLVAFWDGRVDVTVELEA